MTQVEKIRQMKHYNIRLTTILNELSSLEDGVDFDYTELLSDLALITRVLEQRRERLQRRGRTQ